jgi:chemotaxis protein CheZ
MSATDCTAGTLSAEETRDRLGNITRQLHQAIVELGLDGPLKAVANQIPDARERLEYVGQMTERAAHKVLGTVEQAQPSCREAEKLSRSAATDIEQVLADPHAGSEQLRAVLDRARGALLHSAAVTSAQHDALSEIMMSQDFQDLSGQVIQKVVKIITETEDQLLGMLLRHAPFETSDLKAPSSELQGPQVAGKALEQGDVDDLLASLGF